MSQINRYNHQQQQAANDYLSFLLKVKQLKKAQLLETNKKLAAEKAIRLGQTTPIQYQSSSILNQNTKAFSNLILSYYSNLDEAQKKSVEKTLTLSKYKDRLPRKGSITTLTNGYSYLEKSTNGRGHTRSHSQSNYTCEEYGNWLKTKPPSVSDECTG